MAGLELPYESMIGYRGLESLPSAIRCLSPWTLRLAGLLVKFSLCSSFAYISLPPSLTYLDQCILLIQRIRLPPLLSCRISAPLSSRIGVFELDLVLKPWHEIELWLLICVPCHLLKRLNKKDNQERFLSRIVGNERNLSSSSKLPPISKNYI